MEENGRYLLVYLRNHEKLWIEVRPIGHGTSDVSGRYVDFSVQRNPPDGSHTQPGASHALVLIKLAKYEQPPPKDLFGGAVPSKSKEPDFKQFADVSLPLEGRAVLSLHSHCGRRCLLCQDHYRQRFSRLHRWKRRVFDWHLSVSERFARNTLERPDFAWIERQATQKSHLLIHGPDATLNPYLEEVVRRAKDAGFQRVEVQAPGGGLQDPQRVARLADAGLDRVLLPLHSLDPETYDSIVQAPGALAVLLKAIENLERCGVDFQLNLPLMRQNLHDFLETARICEEKGWELLMGLWFPEKGYGWGYADLSPSFAELRVLEGLCRNGEPFRIDYLPPCAYPATCREQASRQASVDDLENYGLKHPSICSECIWLSGCPGAHPVHLEAFGENDLEPTQEKEEKA